MGFHNSHRQHGNSNYHRQDNAQDCSIDHYHQTSYKWNGHHQDSRDGVGNKGKFTKRPHTRIHVTESGSEHDSQVLSCLRLCGTLEGGGCTCTSLIKQLIHPSQVIENGPKNLTGSPFHEENVRHLSSHVYTLNNGSETEIVHIGRKSQNECAVGIMIGARSQKAPWDSGADRCIISYDCYNSLHPKYKTELFPSSVRFRAANGTFIANKGECDITLKINNERFTFPFLCSDQLSQQMIPGHNFSKAYHIGMLWNADDVMSLTRNGIPFVETLPTNDINVLVFCAESTVILLYSN